MNLIGIDIGSGSCKGVLFNADGNVLASHRISYQTNNPAPGISEIDATNFRDAVFGVISQLARSSDADVATIGISSHGETIVPVNRNGEPTGAAIMNSDNRAIEETEWWENSFGREKIYAITGLPLHPMFSLNKILWIKRNNASLYNESAYFLSVAGYVAMQLGARPAIDFTLACRTMAFDIQKMRWSEEIIDHCGVALEKLGEVVPSGAELGRIDPALAKQLGINKSATIVISGHDQPCGAVGAGATNEGNVFDSTGSYECLVAVTDSPRNTATALQYNFNSYCHVLPGKYVTLAFFPAGLVSAWYVDNFCGADIPDAQKQGISLHDYLARKVQEHAPGPTGICITPHLVGACTPHWDPAATGVVMGLTPGATRYHLYKAIFEGIACELSVNMQALEEVVGKISKLSMAGGNSRLQFTAKLRADITGKSFQASQNEEAVCVGAAVLGGVSCGLYQNLEEALHRLSKVEQVIDPTAERSKYEHQLNRYKKLYPALKHI